MRIKELLNIEENMHKKLEVILELFKKPIERDPSLLSSAAARQIFQNLDIICDLSQSLESTLRSRFNEYDNEETCISSVYFPFVRLVRPVRGQLGLKSKPDGFRTT